MESQGIKAKGLALGIGVALAGLLLYGWMAVSRNGSSRAGFQSVLRLSLDVSEGWLISHDFTLTNTSGEDLSEVNLTMRTIGEDGAPVVERYWARWPLGGTQAIAIPVSSVTNLQRIELTGSADQGRIDQTFELNN